MAARRFSQAISEGDGISVLVEVHDAESARGAERDGAALAELFAPPRGDWGGLDRLPASPVTLF